MPETTENMVNVSVTDWMDAWLRSQTPIRAVREELGLPPQRSDGSYLVHQIRIVGGPWIDVRRSHWIDVDANVQGGRRRWRTYPDDAFTTNQGSVRIEGRVISRATPGPEDPEIPIEPSLEDPWDDRHDEGFLY